MQSARAFPRICLPFSALSFVTHLKNIEFPMTNVGILGTIELLDPCRLFSESMRIKVGQVF